MYTVGDEAKIADHQGTPARGRRLACDGKLLEDDGALKGHRVLPGSTFHLRPQIFVESLFW